MVEKADPQEFRDFVRELAIHAFDHFAARGSRSIARRSESLAKLANCWKQLSEADKELFFDELIAAAQGEATFTMTSQPARSTGSKKPARAGAGKKTTAAKRKKTQSK
jgi:hypothetical protein